VDYFDEFLIYLKTWRYVELFEKFSNLYVNVFDGKVFGGSFESFCGEVSFYSLELLEFQLFVSFYSLDFPESDFPYFELLKLNSLKNHCVISSIEYSLKFCPLMNSLESYRLPPKEIQ
jgi:hypothetical protein